MSSLVRSFLSQKSSPTSSTVHGVGHISSNPILRRKGSRTNFAHVGFWGRGAILHARNSSRNSSTSSSKKAGTLWPTKVLPPNQSCRWVGRSHGLLASPLRSDDPETPPHVVHRASARYALFRTWHLAEEPPLSITLLLPPENTRAT